jgi:hypothetical protein
MAEPTMETLARRLDRVERENRRLKRTGVVALAVIAAVMLMGQATESKVAKVVEAEKFVLRDAKGEKSADLEVKSDGSVMLGIGRGPMDGRIVLVAGGEKNPTLSIFGKKQKGQVVMFINSEGNPGLLLQGLLGAMAYLGEEASGSTALRLHGPHMLPRLIIRVEANGVPGIALLDEYAKVIWSAP